MCVSAYTRKVLQATQSQNILLLSVLKVPLEMENRSFSYAAPVTWNLLQQSLCLVEMLSLNLFKGRLKVMEGDASGCRCFDK